MLKTPAFSSPPNFWKTCLPCSLPLHFSLCHLQAPAPSVAWKLFWQRPAITSCLGKSLETFSCFIIYELFPLTISSSMDVFFLWLLVCHSLLVLDLLCWPLYLQPPLEYQCSPGSVLGYLSSLPSHCSLANTLIPMASTTTAKPAIMSSRFSNQYHINSLCFYCKNCFHYSIKCVWFLEFLP